MKIVVLGLVASVLGHLPLSINRWIGRWIGRWIYLLRSRHCRTSFRNLQHCFPAMPISEQKRLVYQSSLQSGMMMTEAFWIWKQSPARIASKIESETGRALIEQALAKGKGVLLIGPHFGSWELITFWCGQYFDSAALFRPAKITALNQIIVNGRQKTGARLIAGERKNARQILEHLKQGKLFILLTDQEPEKGSGCYVNFFGQPAYTMNLPKKLVDKSGATVLLFFIERTTRGFKVTIQKPQQLSPDLPLKEYLQVMNHHLESIINTQPAQFEWGYKRFKSPPDGDYDFYPE
jgi:KDO2-lipid IV(A) lauroyltransferase